MPFFPGAHTAKGLNSATQLDTDGIITQPNGSGLVACVTYTEGAHSFDRLLDNYNNPWLPIFNEVATPTYTAQRMYYCPYAKGGPGHVLSLFLTAAGPCSLWFMEIKTGGGGIRLDLANAIQDTVSPFTSPGILTTAADEFLVGWHGANSCSGTIVHTPGNSFQLFDDIQDGNTLWPGATAYRIVNSVNTYNTSWTLTGNDTNPIEWIAAFKEQLVIEEGNMAFASF